MVKLKLHNPLDLAMNKGIFGQAYRQGRDEATAEAQAILTELKTKFYEAKNKIKIAKIITKNARIEAESAKMAAENAEMAVAENARIEAEKNRIFLSLLHGWHKQADTSLIADIANISLKESLLWIASFEYIKANRAAQKDLTPKQWCKLLEKKKTKYFPLLENQIIRLLELLDKTT